MVITFEHPNYIKMFATLTCIIIVALEKGDNNVDSLRLEDWEKDIINTYFYRRAL